MDTQYQCRPDESNSNRYILENTRLDSVTGRETISLLIEYKTLLSEYNQLDAELSNYNKILFYKLVSDEKDIFSQKADALVSKMDKLETQILDLETRPQLLGIVEKHRAEKARQRAKEERDNRLHRFRTDPSFDPDKLTSTDIAWVAAQKELDIDTVKKILYLERQETLKKEQTRKTAIKKRAQNSIDEINYKLFKISIGLIVACLVFAFFAGSIARRCYAHEVTEEINTYICYTTEYGDLYHEKGCQYLWNSSYKTTVYSAEKRGYDPCSKCTPSQQTTLIFTKKLYWNISKTKTSENEPSFMLWLCCSLCLIPIYFLLTFNLKKKRKEEYYWIESTK